MKHLTDTPVESGLKGDVKEPALSLRPRRPGKRMGSFLKLCVLLILANIILGLYFYSSVSALRVAIPVCAAIVSVLIAIGLYVYILPGNYALSWKAAFPVLFTVCGLSYTLFLSPMTVPDEVYHYTQSYVYSNLMLSGHPDIFRKADLDFLYSEDPGGITISAENWRVVNREIGAELDSSDLQGVIDADRAKVFAPDANPIQVKIASTLGIAIGRVLGLNAMLTFYLGRLFALACGLAIIVLAVNITPVGKNSMMAIALFPMTLQLLGSYSYDSGIIALAFLLTALILKLLYAEGVASTRTLVCTLLVAVLLAPCKVVYYPIAFLALLAPKERFASRRAGLIFKVLLVVLPVAAIVAYRLSTIASLTTAQAGSALDHRGTETGTFYSISDILKSPFAFCAMVLRTFQTLGDFYLTGIVGGDLGWFQQNIEAPYFFSCGMLFISAIASLPSDDDATVPSKGMRAMSVLLSVASGSAIFLSMYLGWTFNTEQIILGVQGRYFIPFLPLLYLALRNGRLETHGRMAMPTMTTLASIDLMYLAYIAMCALAA